MQYPAFQVQLSPGLEEWFAELRKDLRQSCRELRRLEVRYLVDLYYQIQHYRIAAGHQANQCDNAGEPVRFLDWCFRGFEKFEGSIRTALNTFAKEYRVGRWCLSQDRSSIG